MENKRLRLMSKIWDKMGICASGICLIHCLVTPVLLLVFPTFQFGFIGHESFHHYLTLTVVISIVFAVYPTCREHGHKDIIALAAAGVLSVVTALFLHEISEFLEQSLTILGSVFLIAAQNQACGRWRGKGN